jgi:hypothetical protein
MAKSFKLEGVSFNVEVVNTFDTEKAFVDHFMKIEFGYNHLPKETKSKLLAKVYKECKKTK